MDEQEAKCRASHAETRARTERWNAELAKANQSAATPAAPAQPSADDLALINRAQAYRGPDGRRLYESDPKVRANLENWRASVFNGERLPADVVAATLAKLEGRPAPAPAATATPAPAEPTGSPLERAQARLSAEDGYLDCDDWSNAPPEVQRELASGYTLDLSGGFVLTGDDVAQLKAARAAGVTQAQVDQFVREMRRQQR